MTLLPHDPALLAAVIDALTGHIAVLDARGVILTVNHAWRRFALENGLPGQEFLVGTSYVSACEQAVRSGADETAAEALRGICAVLDGEPAFLLEYPCHAPHQERWFILRATRAAAPDAAVVVVCHDDITARKRAETELARTHAALEAAHADLEAALAREWTLARTDPLTGASNRRHFLDLAVHELAVSRRYGHPLSIVLFDVDHFKQVNDALEHRGGDETLRAVVEVARRHLREADVLARHGGDEFIALLPHSSGDGALSVAERIRVDVAATTLAGGEGGLRLTISCGVAEVHPDDESVDALVHRADRALFAAKRAGRNRTVVADGPPTTASGNDAPG